MNIQRILDKGIAPGPQWKEITLGVVCQIIGREANNRVSVSTFFPFEHPLEFFKIKSLTAGVSGFSSFCRSALKYRLIDIELDMLVIGTP